ncbi:MAG: hypothetical protein A2Z42_01705 [Candidatus Woykebacteria bacterium RBG_19FT_COMBO_43_10]|uniref:Small ribosomal subunit protein bS20 n=1 Tax=Candidatus Woykebacteria bacterium RBG_19FT_COMBO_43_10 TaxID=1802598 RepID=A0A1G1WIP6_9BACT|nr:MAG: hypothetical protein A2Z42_01705 [Candidatus Woykebacteria bacterium RBG_19FT_COMBO_43_10]
MPVIKSAKKKLRADARKKIVNLKVKTQMKSALKKFAANPAREVLAQAYSALDTAAKKAIIPKGRANRKKARLAALLSKSSKSKPTPPKNVASKKRRSTKISSQTR